VGHSFSDQSSLDNEKKPPKTSSLSDTPNASEMEELYRRLQPEMQRSLSNPDAIAAALEAAQRLASETDAENGAADVAEGLSNQSVTRVCGACGYRNRGVNKFCGMCGGPVTLADEAIAEFARPEPESRRRPIALHPNPFLDPEPEPPRPAGNETHHYHHHYHHHYFPGGGEAGVPRAGSEPAREVERARPTAALRGDMSRAEAGVRRVTQEWVVACNTKHLDDLLDVYTPDALVLRSNYPPVRGAAAVREFFFAALDAGLGEVEIDPLRVDVVGDLAYEAGKFKALVPSATGKRREERGKYLWVCARQGNGEWKLAADCWSSDLTYTTMEADVPAGTAVKSSQPRRS